MHDACTGSGCIPVALSVEEPRVQVVATDASETALKFAARIRESAAKLQSLTQDLLALESDPPPVPGKD